MLRTVGRLHHQPHCQSAGQLAAMGGTLRLPSGGWGRPLLPAPARPSQCVDALCTRPRPWAALPAMQTADGRVSIGQPELLAAVCGQLGRWDRAGHAMAPEQLQQSRAGLHDLGSRLAPPPPPAATPPPRAMSASERALPSLTAASGRWQRPARPGTPRHGQPRKTPAATT